MLERPPPFGPGVDLRFFVLLAGGSSSSESSGFIATIFACTPAGMWLLLVALAMVVRNVSRPARSVLYC